MQAKFEMTDGLANLSKILDELPSDSSFWNEAQNRFHFVDRLLMECLGWSKSDLNVEMKDGAEGWADYTLGTPAKVVLEAKKQSVHFGDLPIGKDVSIRKIAPLVAASKKLKEAMTQVIGYSTMLGAQCSVVCNGPQILIFQTFNSGASPLDGNCFFFNGFENIKTNFHTLWTVLSPEGVQENRANRELQAHKNLRIPPKASDSITEPFKVRYRNALQQELQSISSLLLEELEDEPELKKAFYNECYVPIEANNRHLMLSRNIIDARYQRANSDQGSMSAFEVVKKPSGRSDISISDGGLLGATSNKPIILLGDVGVGKTSFFENLMMGLSEEKTSNTITLHLNLGTKANLTKSVKDFVLDAIPEYLSTLYGISILDAKFAESVLSKELEQFDRSPAGQLKSVDEMDYRKSRLKFMQDHIDKIETYISRCLQFLAGKQNKQIIVFVDNSDQRKFETQQEAFLIAQELATLKGVLVFISLRPSTFLQSKEKGALSGYRNKVLTISPPPADRVIQKRIEFALRIADGTQKFQGLANVRLNLTSVVAFLKATLRAIKSNQEIRHFLSNISGGNTRSVVELVSSFVGSPNVDSRKIVEIEERSGDYKVPLHEFTKHALLGEYAYYSPRSSLYALNLYDIAFSDPREHFLGSLITAYLNSDSGKRDNDGFTYGEAIIDEMGGLGFSSDQTSHRLRSLAEKRLIETPHAHYREISVGPGVSPSAFHFRTTSIGNYHIRQWSGTFAFLDAMSTDTPIFDEQARDSIQSIASSSSISDRFERSTLFRDYLHDCWTASSLVPAYYDFQTVQKVGDPSFRLVERFLRRT